MVGVAVHNAGAGLFFVIGGRAVRAARFNLQANHPIGLRAVRRQRQFQTAAVQHKTFDRIAREVRHFQLRALLQRGEGLLRLRRAAVKHRHKGQAVYAVRGLHKLVQGLFTNGPA